MFRSVGNCETPCVYELSVENWGSPRYCEIVLQRMQGKDCSMRYTIWDRPKESGEARTWLTLCLDDGGCIASIGLYLSSAVSFAASDLDLGPATIIGSPKFNSANPPSQLWSEDVRLNMTVKWLQDNRLHCSIDGQASMSSLMFQISPEVIISTKSNGEIDGAIIGPFTMMDRYIIDQIENQSV